MIRDAIAPRLLKGLTMPTKKSHMSLTSTFYMLVFFWVGIAFTFMTLDGLPREEWTSEIVKLGVSVTVAIALVEVVFQMIRRRGGAQAQTVEE